MTIDSASPVHILPYLLFIAGYVALCLTSELTRNRLFHLTAIGLALFFAGFRNALSPDMERYRFFYEHYRTGASWLRLLEPSFVVISAALNHLGLDYHALFFFYTLITIGFVYAAIRNLSGYVKTSMLLYILVPHLYLGLFIEMRQEAAVAVVFYAMSLVPKKEIRLRRLKIVALAALSVTLHYSAGGYWVIYLLCARLFRRELPLKLYTACILATLLIPSSAILSILAAVFYPILPAAYKLHVSDLESLGQSAGAHSLISIVIFNSLALVFIFARRFIRPLPESFSFFVNIFVLGVLILNLTRSYGDIARFANYFIIYEVTLLPVLLYRTGKVYWRPAAVYFVMLLYFAHFVHGLYYLNAETNSYIYLHYRNALISGL